MFYLFIVVLVLLGDLPESHSTIKKLCEPIDCQEKIKECPYGYRKIDGCEICQCYNPCHLFRKSMICGANRRCFVDRNSNGTFVTRCRSLKTFKNRTICEQPKTTGVCKAAIPRFYYDSHMGTCKQFLYGGCGGNENNFQAEDECTKTCIN